MVRKLLAPVLGVVLLGMIGTGQAGPFTLTDDTGFPGNPVTLELIDDDPSGFLGVNLLIQFDPSQLEFIGPQSGDSTGDLYLGNLALPNVLEPGKVLMNLIPSCDPVLCPLDGLPHSLLDLNLMISAAATPGQTPVTVACDVGEANGGFGLYNSCELDYDIPLTTGFVTVLQSTPGEIPEPSTLALLLLTAVAVGAMRRQRIANS